MAQKRNLARLKKRTLGLIALALVHNDATFRNMFLLMGTYYFYKWRELDTRIEHVPMRLRRVEMTLADVPALTCKTMYKFRKQHLGVVMLACGWRRDDVIEIGGHYGSITAEAAILFFLNRFFKGTQNVDAALVFGIHHQTLGVLFNLMCKQVQAIALLYWFLVYHFSFRKQ